MNDNKEIFCPVCGIIIDEKYNPAPTKCNSGIDIILGVMITLFIELIVIGVIFGLSMVL